MWEFFVTIQSFSSILNTVSKMKSLIYSKNGFEEIHYELSELESARCYARKHNLELQFGGYEVKNGYPVYNKIAGFNYEKVTFSWVDVPEEKRHMDYSYFYEIEWVECPEELILRNNGWVYLVNNEDTAIYDRNSLKKVNNVYHIGLIKAKRQTYVKQLVCTIEGIPYTFEIDAVYNGNGLSDYISAQVSMGVHNYTTEEMLEAIAHKQSRVDKAIAAFPSKQDSKLVVGERNKKIAMSLYESGYTDYNNTTTE
jgi:hypothetical protein